MDMILQKSGHKINLCLFHGIWKGIQEIWLVKNCFSELCLLCSYHPMYILMKVWRFWEAVGIATSVGGGEHWCHYTESGLVEATKHRSPDTVSSHRMDGGTIKLFCDYYSLFCCCRYFLNYVWYPSCVVCKCRKHTTIFCLTASRITRK